MDHFEVFLAALFVSVAGLNVLARWINVPYPIPLVIGGVVIGLLPGMPDIELNPDLVLLVFLPPLLYSAAFFSDLRELRRYSRAITMSAIGGVLVTMAMVAVVAHEVAGLSWALAFALGAIVSPTDPIAATAIMRSVGASRRTVNVIEGESLVNDASALVAYRVAVAAAVGGTFGLADASLEFALAAGGGIAIGLIVGKLIAEIRRRIEDPVTEITISLLTAYAAFIPADELGLSGVLAAVTSGLYLGWHAPELVSPETRIQSFGTWEVLTFLLNATLFILVGLQLPVIMEGLEGVSTAQLAGYSAAVCGTVIGSRYLWLYTAPYVLRMLDRRPSQRERRVGWRDRVVYGWAGMRGAVSMAAALALPFETDSGAPLPDRDLILFLTFAVIFVTVVGQGLSLPWLIRRLGLVEDGSDEEHEELKARIVASRSAIEALETLQYEDWTNDDTIERMKGMHEFRIRRFKTRAGKMEDEDGIEDRSLAYQRLVHELAGAQRAALVRLRNEGTISSEVMRRVERDLDLEESRLEV